MAISTKILHDAYATPWRKMQWNDTAFRHGWSNGIQASRNQPQQSPRERGGLWVHVPKTKQLAKHMCNVQRKLLLNNLEAFERGIAREKASRRVFQCFLLTDAATVGGF